MTASQADLNSLAARILRSIGPLAEEVTIVGGLAPGLLVPQPPASVGPHVGTIDIDFGLAIALDEDEAASFRPLDNALRSLDCHPKSGAQPHRWISPDGIPIDFLCGVPMGYREGGQVPVTTDLAAAAFGASPLARLDRHRINLPLDETSVPAWVAGAAALLALKLDAISSRAQPRDAYDVIWLLRAWEGGPAGAATAVQTSAIANRPEWTGRRDLLLSAFKDTSAPGAALYAAYYNSDPRRALEAVTTMTAFRRHLELSE